MLAAVGCKEFDSVEQAASKVVKVIETVKPDSALVEYYEVAYKKFVKIYPKVKDLYTELI